MCVLDSPMFSLSYSANVCSSCLGKDSCMSDALLKVSVLSLFSLSAKQSAQVGADVGIEATLGKEVDHLKGTSRRQEQ